MKTIFDASLKGEMKDEIRFEIKNIILTLYNVIMNLLGIIILLNHFALKSKFAAHTKPIPKTTPTQTVCKKIIIDLFNPKRLYAKNNVIG